MITAANLAVLIEPGRDSEFSLLRMLGLNSGVVAHNQQANSYTDAEN